MKSILITIIALFLLCKSSYSDVKVDTVSCCNELLYELRISNEHQSNIILNQNKTNISLDSIIKNLKDKNCNVNLYCGGKDGVTQPPEKSSIWDFILKEFWKFILSALMVIITAAVTAYFTKRKQFQELKSGQVFLTRQVENDTYRTLYKDRLVALKQLRQLSFKSFKTHFPLEDASIEDIQSSAALSAKEVTSKLHTLILNYGYLFGREIYASLLDFYNLCNDAIKEVKPNNETKLYEKGEKIYKAYEDLMQKIEDLLLEPKETSKKTKSIFNR